MFSGRLSDRGEDANDGPEPGGVGQTVEDQLHRREGLALRGVLQEHGRSRRGYLIIIIINYIIL